MSWQHECHGVLPACKKGWLLPSTATGLPSQADTVEFKGPADLSAMRSCAGPLPPGIGGRPNREKRGSAIAPATSARRGGKHGLFGTYDTRRRSGRDTHRASARSASVALLALRERAPPSLALDGVAMARGRTSSPRLPFTKSPCAPALAGLDAILAVSCPRARHRESSGGVVEPHEVSSHCPVGQLRSSSTTSNASNFDALQRLLQRLDVMDENFSSSCAPAHPAL